MANRRLSLRGSQRRSSSYTIRSAKRGLPVLTLAAVGVGLLLVTRRANAGTFTWNGAATGTWGTVATNWSGASGTPWDSTSGPGNSADFNTASLAATVSGTVYANGIIFDTAGSLSSGTITLAGTVPTIATNANGSISSVLAGTAGLTKSGAGTLTLTGSNTYTGLTTVSNGTLNVSGVSNIRSSAGVTVGSSATVQISATAHNALNYDAGALWTVAGIIDVTSNYANILAGTVTLNGGTLTSTGTNSTYGSFLIYQTGATTINANGAGNVISSTGLGLYSALILNTPMATDALAITTGIGSGTNYTTGSLTKTGAGIVTLSGSNTYSGGTTISGGTLKFRNYDTGFDTISGAITLASPGVLEFNSTYVSNYAFDDYNAITGSGTLNKTGPGYFGMRSTIRLAGQINVQAGILGNDALTTDWTGNTAGLSVNAGASFDLRGQGMIIDALTDGTGGGGTIGDSWAPSGTATITLGVNSGSGSFSGVITNTGPAPFGSSGTVALTKTGTGTQILGGSNTYTGATTISAGELDVTGSTAASSAVTVGDGTHAATLGGSGTVYGTVDVKPAATIDAGVGSTIGTLHTGAVHFENGSFFNVQVSGAAADELVINSATAAVDSGAKISFTVGTIPTLAKYVLATATGGLSASAFSVAGSLPTGYRLTSPNAGELDLQHQATPAITLSGVTAGTRFLTNTSVTGLLTGVVTNAAPTGSDSLNVTTATLASVGSLAVTPVSVTGSNPVAPNGGTVTLAASFNTGTNTGNQTLALSETDSTYSPGVAATSTALTVDVVGPRTINAPTGTLALGRFINAVPDTTSISGTGVLTSATGNYTTTANVTLLGTTAMALNDTNGQSVNVSGDGTIFNGTNGSGTLTLSRTFGSNGTYSGTITLTGSNGALTPEFNSTGLAANVNVVYSADPVAARTYGTPAPTADVSGLLSGATFACSVTPINSTGTLATTTSETIGAISTLRNGYTFTSGAVAFVDSGSVTGTISGKTSFGGGTGHYSVTPASNESFSYSPAAVNFGVNVSAAGLATADNTNRLTHFGPALTAVVTGSTSGYVGLEAQSAACSPTTGAAGTVGTDKGGTALLAGAVANTLGTATVSMAWRTVTSSDTAPLFSNVVELANFTGTDTTHTVVLEMFYNDAAMAPATEKSLFLGHEVGQSGAWQNAGQDSHRKQGVWNGTLTWGDWGQYISSTPGDGTSYVWAVITLDGSTPGNNDFAVIPEPTSVGLLGLGLTGLLWRKAGARRRKAGAGAISVVGELDASAGGVGTGPGVV